MLDNITKKNIDNCRDTLVGKVPDPKSQIEQITLALIYKFMDDMDRESEELGGKPKFFTGEFEKYGWRKLLDQSLGGKEMLDLYSEALDILQTNSNLPELFRNIFKNAYLPYRDPATLKMFLKHINDFEYSHSEKLGDAFEYLLSVMGSQGDAGQFRTPRHVIDFIAKCLDPKKNETVADPACGTSGFLLSAYKHILSENTDKRLGDKLTPDERKRLSENFTGYDISPDMVRLSLVNMYLHGFTTPKIFEYDTLSSEDRWNETFDVILANPPFMTPKGGIRPHKKFGVQANKAEVLFTDYIAEHLNKNGRAGIVVPNGIVATTQTAYKQLRKLLVEDSLIAVISLPAGCFNPYSGVKTSILMLDKSLAKKSDQVLFIKINNDGFDLGAQRREIDKNDLPLALEAFNQFKKHISEGKTFDTTGCEDLCHLVEKEKILSNKDIVLSGERYIEGKVAQTEFEIVKLSSVTKINAAASDPLKLFKEEDFIYIDIESVENGTGKISYSKLLSPKSAPSRARRIIRNGDVIVSTVRPNLKAFAYLENLPKNCLASTGFAVISESDRILGKYLIQVLRQEIAVHQMVAMSGKGQYPSITANDLGEIEIPLPPLEIQEEIVKEIEGYQKIIDGAKMVVDNYKPTISIKPEWEMVELGEVFKLSSGKFLPTKNKIEGSYNVYGGNGINGTHNDYFLENPTLVIGRVGEYCGAVHITTEKSWATDNCLYVTNYLSEVNQVFLKYALISANLNKYSKVGGQPSISQGSIYEVKISIPNLNEQNHIVERIEQEQALVNSNKQLITLFEQKIKDRINEIWGVKEE
jgi:type I restriction enzyme M protein